MMANVQKITPFLWFADEAEEAAKYYCGIFKNSKITRTTHYTEAGKEVHKRPPGSVMVVDFELEGQKFNALNGGPHFKFNEAISLMVNCKDQKEIDYYWEKLGAGGDPAAQQCGWLKDKYGLSWQIVPESWNKFYEDETSGGAQRAMNAMLKMKKLDIAEMERAYKGEGEPAGAGRR
jgi:predicted 3-demethylubiquinone-9 3-methyltransferase (glyoxalase superfamily)